MYSRPGGTQPPCQLCRLCRVQDPCGSRVCTRFRPSQQCVCRDPAQQGRASLAHLQPAPQASTWPCLQEPANVSPAQPVERPRQQASKQQVSGERRQLQQQQEEQRAAPGGVRAPVRWLWLWLRLVQSVRLRLDRPPPAGRWRPSAALQRRSVHSCPLCQCPPALQLSLLRLAASCQHPSKRHVWVCAWSGWPNMQGARGSPPSCSTPCGRHCQLVHPDTDCGLGLRGALSQAHLGKRVPAQQAAGGLFAAHVTGDVPGSRLLPEPAGARLRCAVSTLVLQHTVRRVAARELASTGARVHGLQQLVRSRLSPEHLLHLASRAWQTLAGVQSLHGTSLAGLSR